MSERRRSLFVLLIVAVLMAGSLFVAMTKSTKLGLDLQGGVQLVYHAEPTAQQKTVDADAMQRSIDLMQERVNSFGVNEAALNQAGKDQIEVGLPGVKNAERAAAQVGSTAQLFFYDWEANLLDAKCKTNPDVNSNTLQPIVTLYTAVKQASACTKVGTGEGTSTPSQAASKARFYAFDSKLHKPYANGQTFGSRQEALDALTGVQKENSEIIEVPPGVLVLRAEKASATAPDPDRWWV